jgi:hypothetical protein
MLVATVSAAMLLRATDEAGETGESRAAAVLRELATPDGEVPALPLPPALAPDRAPSRLEVALAPAPTASPDADELARVQGELDRAKLELALARDDREQARMRREEELLGPCVRRFRNALDEWLDGPLAALHEGDRFLRERLRETLETAAWKRRHREWIPETQRWATDVCLEPLEELRLRYPDGVVAELARLFRSWQRDRLREPSLYLVPGCSGSSVADVTCNGLKTRLPIDDPFVQSLLAEQRRSDRYWQDQINALLDLKIYAHETCGGR